MSQDEAIIIYKENILDQGFTTVNKSGQATIHRKHTGKEIRWFLIDRGV